MSNSINTTTILHLITTTTTTTAAATAAIVTTTTTTSVITSPWGCPNRQLLLIEQYREDTTRLAPASSVRLWRGYTTMSITTTTTINASRYLSGRPRVLPLLDCAICMYAFCTQIRLHGSARKCGSIRVFIHAYKL